MALKNSSSPFFPIIKKKESIMGASSVKETKAVAKNVTTKPVAKKAAVAKPVVKKAATDTKVKAKAAPATKVTAAVKPAVKKTTKAELDKKVRALSGTINDLQLEAEAIGYVVVCNVVGGKLVPMLTKRAAAKK